MTRQTDLIADDLFFLGQGLELLERLDDHQYAEVPALGLGSVGGHVRHCLDFYSCFLRGLADGRVDYDSRARDPRLEVDREYAAEAIRTTIAQLHELDDDAVDISLETVGDRGRNAPESSCWGASSGRRELMFLRSHTVHHFALIAALLRVRDIDPGPDFGVAPSTLAHRQAAATS